MKYLKTLKEIIITYILGYIILILSAALYILLGGNNLSTFISTTVSIISLLYIVTVTIYYYHKNKRKELPLNKKRYFPLYYLGLSYSCFMNMILLKIFPNKPISNSLSTIFFLIITSSLIGPIMEEILFRYINLNKLKQITTLKKSILINSLLFSLIHFNLKEIIFTLPLAILINLAYQKDKNILSPILIHSAANLIAIFLTKYHPYILILSIINLTLSISLNQKIFLKKA